MKRSDVYGSRRRGSAPSRKVVESEINTAAELSFLFLSEAFIQPEETAHPFVRVAKASRNRF